MSEEKEFAVGLYVNEPHEKAPDFVKCGIALKRENLISWLQSKNDEYINLQVKSGKNGKWYAEVDHWKPNQAKNNDNQSSQSENPTPQSSGDDFDDDIPDFM